MWTTGAELLYPGEGPLPVELSALTEDFLSLFFGWGFFYCGRRYFMPQMPFEHTKTELDSKALQCCTPDL